MILDDLEKSHMIVIFVKDGWLPAITVNTFGRGLRKHQSLTESFSAGEGGTALHAIISHSNGISKRNMRR